MNQAKPPAYRGTIEQVGFDEAGDSHVNPIAPEGGPEVWELVSAVAGPPGRYGAYAIHFFWRRREGC